MTVRTPVIHLRASLALAGALCLPVMLACSPPLQPHETEACAAGEGCASSTGATDASASASSTSVGGTSTSTATSATTGASATTSATSSSGSTSPGSTSVGCAFLCPPDGGEQGDGCDTFAQDCPDGQKCAPYDSDGDNAWDATKCVAVTGDDPHGEPCTSAGVASGVDSCDVGVMCWNLDEQGEGTCVALCTGTPDNPMCAPPDTTCRQSAGVLALCLDLCDPTLLECPPGNVCVSDFQDAFVCTLDASGGVAPPGSPCAFVNVCNPGSFCSSPDFAPHPDCQEADGCCTAFCDLNAGDAPCQQQDPAFECVPWFEQGQAPPQYEHVGGCGLPS